MSTRAPWSACPDLVAFQKSSIQNLDHSPLECPEFAIEMLQRKFDRPMGPSIRFIRLFPDV